MKKSFFAIAGLMLIMAAPSLVFAASKQDSNQAEGVFHGITESGLTGLTQTVSPYTIGTGISVSVNAVTQPTAGGTGTLVFPSVTVGLGKNIEIGARTVLVTSPGFAATGDTEISAKYKFRDMGEVMPAMAIAASVILPTASNVSARDVTTSGVKFMVIGGGEAQVSDDIVVGTYFNISANFFDPGQAAQSSFVSTALGLMVPISDDKKLQGFLEHTSAPNKTANTPLTGDWNPHTTIGLRYAGRFLKITGGIETGWSSAVIKGGVTFEI